MSFGPTSFEQRVSVYKDKHQQTIERIETRIRQAEAIKRQNASAVASVEDENERSSR